MLLFKRIFDFPRASLARLRDKRRAKRYPVAPGFPLKAVVNLLGVANPAKSFAPAGLGVAWSGAVVDMSGTGLRLQLPPAATTARGERTVLTLSLEDFELRIPCTVAHFRTQSASALCGLSFQFNDDTQRKAYLQLLEAVVVGAGFVAGKPIKAGAGLKGERYNSENKATLTVWRIATDGRLDSLELQIGGHCVRSAGGSSALQVFAGKGTEVTPVAGLEQQEVLRLFRIVAANLPKTLPADLRERMQFLAKPPALSSRR